MAEAPSFVRRVFLPGARGEDEYLRATFHADESVIVFSHWRGNVCIAATPVRVTDATDLTVLLTRALGYVAEHPDTPSEALTREAWWAGWWRRVQRAVPKAG